MPAPAVIPAPVAYYNVVAFKTPVFDHMVLWNAVVRRFPLPELHK